MLVLDLKIDDKISKVKVKDEVLFNAILINHEEVIKKIIKTMSPRYNLSDVFFEIINGYIDFNTDGVSIYPGLIVRTNLYDYAVLFLENTVIDEEYMLYLIKEYMEDVSDYTTDTININKFEVDKETFFKAQKSIL